MIKAYIVENGAIKKTDRFDEVRAAHEAGRTLWLDLETKCDEADELLAKTFHLHALTIEDVWHSRQMPKLEDFDEYLYIRVHGVQRVPDVEDLQLQELDVVVGPNFVISHDATSCAVSGLHKELERSPRLLLKGPPWITHALLDMLIDRYLPVIDDFDERIEHLETEVIDKAGTPKGRAVLKKIFALKRSLQGLRRITIHQREVLLRLSRGEFDEIPPELMPFYRDVFDHFVRVTDLAESYRELVTSALEAYLSVQSNRMNEVMKTLTLMSTVMLPLTFIAGIYGMNFEVMPEIKWKLGYPYALALMGVVAGSILLWFKHKRWL